MVAFISSPAISLLIFCWTLARVHCRFEFTNFKCSSLDSEYMGVDTCVLKSVNRSYKYMSFRTKFKKFPVFNVTGRVQVLKRLNGYKPFLYNFTFDGCKFLRGQRSPLLQFFFDLFAPYSNLVHPCPYNHDIYLEKLPISYMNHRLTNVLPVPEGQYCAHSIYLTQGIPRLELKANCRFEFTNIICTSLDKDFMGFEACLLKSRNRTYKYLTIRTKIHQLPLDEIGVRVEVLKKFNGYKPFLFNFTTEICQFFRGKGTPVVRFFYGLFASYSNLNHSCPFNHDIFVDKLPIGFMNHQLTAVLPVPEGEYCVHSVYSTHGKPRMDLRVYMRIY